MNGLKYAALTRRKIVPAMVQLLVDTGIIHTFQQDNAPCHTANVAKIPMDAAGIKTTNWPAVSPDLNPIENLWGIMKLKLTKLPVKPRNRDELWNEIVIAWNSITIEQVRNCIDSMPRRMIKVILNGGDCIDY